ncbi:hypothetical protein WKW79_24980 [Variovorax robiniae]|uniref:Transmembrane protein n=1 Tax=Variovorax robiniae TaxID=1836199 RepID=A0ABU8XDG5_9BURK
MRALLLAAALGSGPVSAATLQVADWPAERDCTNCIRLQFRRLDLQLPHAEVGKIFTTGTGSLAVELVPPSGDLKQSTSIFDRTQAQLRDLFKKSEFLQAHSIKTPRDYWDTLGTEPASGDKRLALVRKAERIDSARSYTRLSKGRLTAYVVRAAEPDDQRIYFVIDGDETYYMLVGPMSQALVDAVLANARVAEMP